MGSVYVALLHHPVLGPEGQVVTSSVTSLDMHDLARAGRTYGVAGTFVVHPSPPQRLFVRRVLEHFLKGQGRELNPQRGETLEQVQVAADLDAAVEAVEAREGRRPLLAATSAREVPGAVGYGVLRERIGREQAPILLLFGTSWGLAPEVFERSDIRLAPLRGAREEGFNHLPVRSAAAVVLDRLLGAP
ncbi:MAG: RNA methyltransferase [Candidatus Tectomicrobia bacterium]|nr:RNA methyltransferase [Candidatus Tectomicrobia bacterium]MBI3025942.1 RNA methyltransferase [Candidatus Tectomicrobia bacterium]